MSLLTFPLWAYLILFQASAEVLTNFAFHFSDQLIEVSDWRNEMYKAINSFDIFWRMPSGFVECYGCEPYRWFKGEADPISTIKSEGSLCFIVSSNHTLTAPTIDDWLYVLPEDVDQQLVLDDRLSEQRYVSWSVHLHNILLFLDRFIKARFLDLFERLEAAFKQRRHDTIRSLPTFNALSHVQPCPTLLVEGRAECHDGETVERLWSAASDNIDVTKVCLSFSVYSICFA